MKEAQHTGDWKGGPGLESDVPSLITYPRANLAGTAPAPAPAPAAGRDTGGGPNTAPCGVLGPPSARCAAARHRSSRSDATPSRGAAGAAGRRRAGSPRPSTPSCVAAGTSRGDCLRRALVQTDSDRPSLAMRAFIWLVQKQSVEATYDDDDLVIRVPQLISYVAPKTTM